MREARLASAFSLVVLALVVSATVAGCGDDGGNTVDPPTCKATGDACTIDNDCCTGECNDLTMTCARVAGECQAAGAACHTGPDCCSFSCVNFQCAGTQCVSDGAACSANEQCCGGSCVGGTCAPLNSGCRTSGNACQTNGECCSGFCKDGTCNNAPSYCTQLGDTCQFGSECCSGICSVAAGAALGICTPVPAGGATGCTSAGELCGAGADYTGGPLPICGGECCGRACLPYGPTGILICQPSSGCRPTGEVCRDDHDCCGSAGLPDGDRSGVMCSKEPGQTLGRCDNGNACSPAGAICRLQSDSCNANANCCAGNVQQFDTCHLDALGVPRCTTAEIVCTNPEQYVGMVCATSADCCGLPCLPVPGSEFTLRCGAQCQTTGATCTTSTDCCSGLPCVTPPGATVGTCGQTQGCASVGQTCNAQNPCCNNLTCQDGTCTTFIP